MRPLVAALLCFALTFCATAQQTASNPVSPPLTQRAEKVRATVARIAPGGKLSVIPITGAEEFGKLISATEDRFTFHDIDSNADVTFRFEDTRLVRAGYGGYNIYHRHTDPHKNIIIGAIVAASLIGLIVIAASTRD